MKKIVKYLKFCLNKFDEETQLNEKWRGIDYILNSDSLKDDFLKSNSHIPEVEHQVGRYLNMAKVVNDLDQSNINGSLLEFGTWQGLSLIYFAKLLGSNSNNRKFIGVDSFEGLPHNSTIWKKGDFSDTELNFVMNNFKKYSPKSLHDKVHLVKGWYNDPTVKREIFNISNDFALVHFDADLYSSTKIALEMVEQHLFGRNEPFYLLFDDWGCHPNEVPEAFCEWVFKNKLYDKYLMIIVGSTRYTRYYKFEKK